MRKPLDSPASFRPFCTSCLSKLFKRIILSRLLFFLESYSILSPSQAGFHLGRFTLHQILCLSQSILDGFNKPRPSFRKILATNDFSKAFDSVWHSALFHKLVFAGLPPCFASWTQSFFSDRRACVVYQNHKSHSFRICTGAFLGLVLFLFSSTMFLFLCLLPLYADDLAFGPPLSLVRWRLLKKLWFDWSTGFFLSILKNVRPFFHWIPTKLTSTPPLFIQFPIHLRSLLTHSFLLSFSKHVSSLKAKFFPCLKVLRCISASSWGISLFCITLFYSLFSLMLHPNDFLFLALPMLLNWNAFTERPVSKLPAASCSPLFHFPL